ncbi:hypothetical protein FisN_8Hh212 [Fistulifera solaris]|jgi:hypothetical protein|uniref:OCRE domain-containing protein n=1 Tax=Fistulifera solaris TaxID=1519565 RepID=A0A1Z5JZ05_FISSO|nr:hypothetical protein FisN_8Hh212 [Fistulifera solaris]|eukprot:GAX18991.1 hypothetical protein FisN_8Hh212 [Fistulifera solaris]
MKPPVALIILTIGWGSVSSFSPVIPITSRKDDVHHRIPSTTPTTHQLTRQRPRLQLLLDVPDNFFAITFFGLGLLLNISKNFARVRMEERAWEQRLEEARMERLKQDPTLTELDLRRKEAAVEWSAYGTPRLEEEERRRRRVQVMDRVQEESSSRRVGKMSQDEIEAFEFEYGVEYDPYYDDPYTEDDLPAGKFSVDKLYGDRVYENGEIFYKDAQSGMFYRQGCKPRNLSFWG